MSMKHISILLEPFKWTSLNAVDIDDFLSMDIPPRENLLSPWLPQQGLTMIYAPRGIGKTYVALNIAFAVASGSHFFKWHAEKPQGVLYLDGEMPATLMQERIKAITQSRELNLKTPFRLLTPDMQQGPMPDLSVAEDQHQLTPFLDGIQLIIVDNISTLCRRNKENDADAWIPVQEWALRMRASGRSVLFIHHASKGGNQRGTSKREDVLDTVIALQKSEDYDPRDGASFEIHFKKARGFCGEAAEPFKAQLAVDDNGLMHWKTTAVTATTFDEVFELAQQGHKQQEIAEKLNIHKSNVSRHLARAKQEGKLRSCVA